MHPRPPLLSATSTADGLTHASSSQAKMVEAIDDLARKVESVSNLVSELARHGGAGVGRAPPSSAGGGGSELCVLAASLARISFL